MYGVVYGVLMYDADPYTWRAMSWPIGRLWRICMIGIGVVVAWWWWRAMALCKALCMAWCMALWWRGAGVGGGVRLRSVDVL